MRNFVGFGQNAYIGQPGAQAVKLAGISTQVVPLLFAWISYGASTAKPNVNVLVDITSKPCSPLDQIRGIFIDNLASNNPVYVYFPDTGYTVVSKPNSVGWYPVYTNAKQLWVIGEGFLTGDIPTTFILLSNLQIAPSVNVELDQSISLWKASPLISRGLTPYNQNLGIPALGDQSICYTAPIGGVGVVIPSLWGTPLSSGFVYVTGAYLTAKASGVAGSGNLVVVIESTGIAGTLWQFGYPTPNAALPPANQDVLLSLSGQMSVKLDATQTWRLRSTFWQNNPVGINFTTNYTVNPA